MEWREANWWKKKRTEEEEGARFCPLASGADGENAAAGAASPSGADAGAVHCTGIPGVPPTLGKPFQCWKRSLWRRREVSVCQS